MVMAREMCLCHPYWLCPIALAHNDQEALNACTSGDKRSRVLTCMGACPKGNLMMFASLHLRPSRGVNSAPGHAHRPVPLCVCTTGCLGGRSTCANQALGGPACSCSLSLLEHACPVALLDVRPTACRLFKAAALAPLGLSACDLHAPWDERQMIVLLCKVYTCAKKLCCTYCACDM